MTVQKHYDGLRSRILDGSATCGVIGLGYVGLPLSVEMGNAGLRVTGFDVSRTVVDTINRGVSHIQDVADEDIAELRALGRFEATTDMARLALCDVISICVPTPLSKTKDPDMSFVQAATESVAKVLRPGQLIVLESTTYPGTTRDLMIPLLEARGLRVGVDVFLCFSPERVDPGNATWQTKNTPKVIGGLTPHCVDLGVLVYGKFIATMVPVSSPEAAELTKLLENTFRMINIGLANEMAIVCDRLGVDVWEVIDAAATKPFGFMRFTPGPGIGGHCIPLDPHYLAWKMRTLQYRTRMIGVADEINAEMPAFWVQKLQDGLNDHGLALRGARVLVLGVSYKKDIDDLRESPALEILDLLSRKGAKVSFHDEYCPVIVDDGHTPAGAVGRSVPLTDEIIDASDAIFVATDHSGIDYAALKRRVKVYIDTRAAARRPASVVSFASARPPEVAAV